MGNNSNAHSETGHGLFHNKPGLFRYISLALVLCIGIMLSVFLFVTTKSMEDDRIKAGFEQQAKNRYTAFKNIVDNYLQEIEALEAFYAASDKVTRAKFHVFTEKLLSHYERTQALEWIPRVPDSERAAYETEARREGLRDFLITEKKAQGAMEKADRREEYFPILFIEPYKGNEAAAGYDLASEPSRLEALNLARDTGQVSATAGIKLVQEQGESYGVIILRPVYRKGLPADSIEARRTNLEGFVAGAFRIGDLLEEAMYSFVPAGIDIYLYDLSAHANDSFLCFHPSRVRAVQSLHTSGINELTKGLHYSETLDIGGRKWQALYVPTPDYISSGKTWDAWWFLAGGVLVTVLFAGYINLITYQTAQARRYSEELLRVKEGLEHEIAERKKAEERLKASLEEKEVLLREIHHRVKNNMTVIYSLLDLQSKVTLESHDREMLNDAKARIKTMALIHERLYRSKDLAKIDFNDYISDILNNMFMSYVKDPGRIALNIKVIDVALGIDDAIPCGLIINELVSNTLKHAFPEGRKGEVRVNMQAYDNDMVELIVADNGVGLPDDLDLRQKASLGLNLIYALVGQLQGELELLKEEGTGFRVTFSRHK